MKFSRGSVFARAILLWNILALLSGSTFSAFAQGRPQTLWMRGGQYVGGIYPPAFSPDGRYVVIDDGMLLDVYRVSDAMLLHQIRKTWARAPWGFLSDGRIIIGDSDSATSDRLTIIKIYSADTFLLIDSFPAPPLTTGFSYALDISPDGQYLIVNGSLFRMSDRTVITLPRGYYPSTGGYYDYKGLASFAPGGYLIGYWGGLNQPWFAAPSGVLFWNFYNDGAGYAYQSPLFDPSLSVFWSSNEQGTVYRPRWNGTYYIFDRVYSAWSSVQPHWSPDGTMLTLSANNFEAVRDATTGIPLWEHIVPNAGSWIRFSADSSKLIAMPFFAYNSVRTLDPATGAELQRFSWQHDDAFVKFSPNGSLLAARSYNTAAPRDCGVQIWNAADGTLVQNLLAGNSLNAMAWGSDTILLVGHVDFTGNATQPDTRLQAFDITTGNLLWSRSVGGRGVRNISRSPDNTCYVSFTNGDSWVTQKVDPRTGAVLRTYSWGGYGEISPDGKKFASMDYGGITVYDIQRNSSRFFPTDGLSSGNCLSWSPDSQQMVVSGYAALVTLNTVSGTVRVIDNSVRYLAAAWSADGKTLLAKPQSLPSRWVFYDAVTGVELQSYTEDIGLFNANITSNLSAQFSPDNQTFAFGMGWDGTVGVAHNPLATSATFVGGTLALAGVSGNAPAVPITLTFAPSDQSGDIVRTVWIDSSGAFAVRGLPRASYRLTARADRYLTRSVPVDLASNSTVPLALTMDTGDANGDNAVDIADLLIIIAHYNQSAGSSGYLEAADFDADGNNDINDLLLTIAAYNHIGD